MTYVKDSFDDAELTLMAAEIIIDFATKATAFNPFHYLFPSVDDGISAEMISLSGLSSENTDDYAVDLDYPSLSPKIVCSSKLLPNDSFNLSLPPIPTKNQAINGCSTCTYIPPPKVAPIFIEESSSSPSNNVISSCISPRSHTPKNSECHAQIPYFDENKININTCAHNKHKYKPKKRKKKTHKNKNKNKNKTKTKTYTKYTIKRIISPILINFDRVKIKDNKDQQIKQSRTLCLKNERKNKNMNRKNRAHSVDTNEYVVELEHGFIFVNNNDNVESDK